MTTDAKPSREDILRELSEAQLACQRALAEVEHQRRLKESLEEAVRSRDAVLSVVAHDLRNPLNIVALAANTLLPRLPDATARRLAERIIRSTQRADHMLRDLLTISAIETGRFASPRRAPAWL